MMRNTRCDHRSHIEKCRELLTWQKLNLNSVELLSRSNTQVWKWTDSPCNNSWSGGKSYVTVKNHQQCYHRTLRSGVWVVYIAAMLLRAGFMPGDTALKIDPISEAPRWLALTLLLTEYSRFEAKSRGHPGGINMANIMQRRHPATWNLANFWGEITKLNLNKSLCFLVT
jgi:hypothetical protein